MSFHVIGITGPKRSGKNSAATLVDCLADERYLQISLADPIKDGFDRLSGPGRELHKDLDEHRVANRKAWQLAGTEARDWAGEPLIWCKLAKVWISYLTMFHPRRYDRFTIPDIRFPHEEAFFRAEIPAMGGQFELWGVRNDRVKPAEDGHSSEAHFDKLTPDRFVDNNRSKWDLAHEIHMMLRFPNRPQIVPRRSAS